MEETPIKIETLGLVLSKMLGETIVQTDYETERLHGGTLGDVLLVVGEAKTASGDNLPYKVVWKRQKKWGRPGDPGSWRREYDLYQEDLGKAFTPALRWAECYHSELRDSEIELWIECIDGVTGNDLTLEMLEQAALELGRFQGRVAKHHDDFRSFPCLGDEGFLAREFNQWHTQTFSYDFLVSERSRIPKFLKQMLRDGNIQLVDGKSFEYSYLRSTGCVIPRHLREMLIDIDERKDELFARLNSLPIVLCHRDFWIENIFFTEGNIRLIDWDTTGWGFIGEDIASLVVDDMDASRFAENLHVCLPAYLKGLSEYTDIAPVDESCLLTMILIKFGYRMMQDRMFISDPDKKCWGADALQKLYEMSQP